MIEIEQKEFIDEQIIEMIREKEKEIELESRKVRIENGILSGIIDLDDLKMEFEEKSLYEGSIKICIPKSFVIMNAEYASIKYPSERRPQIIYTDETTSKNICFNHLDTDTLEKDIEKFKDSMRQVLESIQPAAIWFEDGSSMVHDKKLAYFEFISPAIDAKIYNFIFFAEIKGKALICTINCIEEDMGDWMLLARGMMKSFETCIKK